MYVFCLGVNIWTKDDHGYRETDKINWSFNSSDSSCLSLLFERELRSIWPTSRSDQKHKNVIYQMVFIFSISLKLIFEEKGQEGNTRQALSS